MNSVKVYPAAIVAVNGSTTGPFSPGASSSFVYTVAVTMDDGVKQFVGIAPPASVRQPDTFDMFPLQIGEVVFCYRVGERVMLKDCEHVFATEGCP